MQFSQRSTLVFLGVALMATNVTVARSAQANAFDSISLNPEFSISFPQPLQLSVMAYCDGDSFLCDDSMQYFLIGGYFGLALHSDSLQIYNVELGARTFLFDFPLYFSLGIGYRNVTPAVNISSFQIGDSSVATNMALNLYSFYAEPAVGWEFPLSDQFALSVQLGVQVPFFPGGNLNFYNSQTGANSNNSSELAVDNANYWNHISNIPLPTFQLRLSWYI